MAFVLCLDTVGRGNSLHLHVSKPPREGTLQHAFLRELEMVGAPPGSHVIPCQSHAHFTGRPPEALTRAAVYHKDSGADWDICPLSLLASVP